MAGDSGGTDPVSRSGSAVSKYPYALAAIQVPKGASFKDLVERLTELEAKVARHLSKIGFA